MPIPENITLDEGVGDNRPGKIQVSSETQELKVYRRDAAAAYVTARWGFPCSVSWLAKLAVLGGGPIFRKAGRFPIYTKDDLDHWAQARISAPVRSTSELSELGD